MSDTTAEVNESSTTDGSTDTSGTTSTAGDEFKAITTQEDLNKILSDRIARERAKFKDYSEIKAQAAELAEIKNAQKSVEQRQAEELATARQEAESARTEALRWRIATTHGIPAEDAELFLTGRDEETMTAQAKRLAARQAPPEKPELRPDRSQGPRGGGTANPAQQFAEIIRNGTTAR